MNRIPGASGPAHDAELVERVKNGQTEAFNELVLRYQDRLFNTCWRICGNLEDARDLTQQAFIKAYEALPSFRRESAFYTWIYRVAVNLALSHRRSSARHRTVSIEQALQGSQAETFARSDRTAETGADESAAESDMLRKVAGALHTLEDDDRAVVVLRDIEGLDYREISLILEIPSGTVKSRLHRARLALRAALIPGGNPDRGH